MTTPLNTFRDSWAHPHRPAREWHDRGGKVAAYICDNLPEELLIAADVLPVRVRGSGAALNPAVRRLIDTRRASRVIRPDFVPPMAEPVLNGEYAYAQRLIVPHSRKAIQELYGLFGAIREAEPTLGIPEPILLDRTYGSDFAASRYNRNQLARFREAIEAWTGTPIMDVAIAEAIALTNRARTLLREFAAWRAGPDSPVSGEDALAVMGCSMLMPKRDFVSVLEQLLADRPAATGAARKRIFVGGSPFDHAGAYRSIERHGAVVVAEDHCWGARCGDFPVDEAGDPFEMLASRYHAKPACSIAFPLERVVALSTDRALAAKVDGAIFLVQPGDQMQLWETPDEIAVLRDAGMPVLHLPDFPYSGECDDATDAKIAEFVAALPHGRSV